MNFKSAMKLIIKENNLSNQRLADRLGYNRASGVGNMIMRNNCTIETLIKICEVTDYEIILKPKGNGRSMIKIDSEE